MRPTQTTPRLFAAALCLGMLLGGCRGKEELPGAATEPAAAVRQLGGEGLNGPGWEFWGYVVTALLVPVIAVAWAVTDKTRWSNLVLAVVGPTVVVMLHRMQVIWFGQW